MNRVIGAIRDALFLSNKRLTIEVNKTRYPKILGPTETIISVHAVDIEQYISDIFDENVRGISDNNIIIKLPIWQHISNNWSWILCEEYWYFDDAEIKIITV